MVSPHPSKPYLLQRRVQYLDGLRAKSCQVTKVAEPSAYGVVVTKPGSTVIDRFVEKPVEFVGNRINAGIYMFNPSILNRIEVSLGSLYISMSDGRGS